ncbi:MAG: GNAT family N-acetyltransferase [Bdellovibrionaceae bacterium]|nr:GNAT family N-acetyltransferase [Pseudobdellovibrionaceae bacterium]
MTSTSSAHSSIRIEAFSSHFSNQDDAAWKTEFVRAFSGVPDDVRRDPYRVGLIPAETWSNFIRMPLPFTREFWVAFGEGGRPIARLGANLSPTLTGFGYLGFFEVDVAHREAKTIARQLLSTALQWLKDRGAMRAFGPLTYNTWFPYRFRAFDENEAPSPMFSWEPVNPPEYVSLWQEFGFQEAERYHSQGLENLRGFAEQTEPAYQAALKRGYTFRPWNAAAILEDEVPLLHKFSLDGFRPNFLFEPIPLESFRQLYVPLAKKANLSLANFVVDPQGVEQGFFFCFQDQNYMVMKTATVASAARGLGLSNAMAHIHAVNALKMGCDKFVTALVRSGAQSESYAKKTPLLWKHEYILLQHSL